MQQSEIIIFYSYSLSDGALQKKLDQHLSLCMQDRLTTRLHIGNIDVGKRVQQQIDQAIDTASLILLLVSPDFLNDAECQRQMERAMDRQESDGTFVIPIILRACIWRNTRFGELQCLPRSASPVGELDEPILDKALTDIAKELSQAIVASPSQIPTSQQVAYTDPESLSDLDSGELLAWPSSKDGQAGSAVNEYKSAGPPSAERPDIPIVRRGSYRAGYALAVDIGRSHVTCCLAKMDAEIIHSQVRAPLDTARLGGERTLLSVAEDLLGLASDCHISWDQVRGIAISVPGVPDKKHLISPPLMGKWFTLDIPAFLKSKLPKTQKPLPIYLNNDANMGAFGESRSVKGRVIKNLVYVKVGTGIGSGLILEGQLYRGHGGAAGEFGHILLEQETGETLPACVSCGKRGCLESLAGEHAIIEEVRELREREGSSKSIDLTMDGIVEAAERGDSACRRALRNAGNRLGRAIGGCLVNIFNPSHIMLDGSVIRADEKGSQLLYTTLCQSAARSSLAIMQGTKIDIARLGDKAVAYGAIMTVIEEHKNRKSLHL